MFMVTSNRAIIQKPSTIFIKDSFFVENVNKCSKLSTFDITASTFIDVL